MNVNIPNKKFLTPSEFANAIGVHPETLRKWDRAGKLKPHHTTTGGHRQYSVDQIKAYFDGEYNK